MRGLSRPRLLDLYCGAGGAAAGYAAAGWDVLGVDHRAQPRYPFAFVQADALAYLERLLAGGTLEFDAIHASPPCHRFSTVTGRNGRRGQRRRQAELELGAHERHPDLVHATRELLLRAGRPYIVENVPGAPLLEPVQLCGSSFGLDVRRHRWFESNVPLLAPPCLHAWQLPRFRSLDYRTNRRAEVLGTVPVYGQGTQLAGVVGVHGHLSYSGELALRERAMGIDWMTPAELTQAVPPAYTRLLGAQLLAAHEAAYGVAIPAGVRVAGGLSGQHSGGAPAAAYARRPLPGAAP